MGLTNMGSTPLRARGVEEALAGQPATADGRTRRRPSARPRAPTRPRTSTAMPTTGVTCARAHPTGRAGRSGSLSGYGADPPVQCPDRGRGDVGHFEDIAPVAECFPGPRSPRPRATPSRARSRSSSADRARLQRRRHVLEKDEAAHRFVVDAKGKDKRGNGTAGASAMTMADSGRRDQRRGGHRPRGHRQARTVRPGRHAGRLGQAAGPVRGLPRAAARRRIPQRC